jgi:peptidoglycan L-alanyl-D-glutamate endopeptidase CwlK
MASRAIKDMVKELQLKYAAFAARMGEACVPFIITCTYRSQEEQDLLYAQGRTQPGRIVTWTKNSMHTKRRAFDIAICKDGIPNWNVKVDVNGDQVGDYEEAGHIAESVGLEWGGRWSKPDYCHFQLT